MRFKEFTTLNVEKLENCSVKNEVINLNIALTDNTSDEALVEILSNIDYIAYRKGTSLHSLVLKHFRDVNGDEIKTKLW